MAEENFDATGPLAVDAPHVRLAGLRLAELARDVREALATPAAGMIEADLDFPDWVERAAPRAQAALMRLGENMAQLAQRILLHDGSLKVTDVDNTVASLREDFLALLALRDATTLRRFPEAMKTHAFEATERISHRLRDLGSACALLSAMILHPERMQTDGALDLGISLDLDLAHELRGIAAKARGPIALWRYC